MKGKWYNTLIRPIFCLILILTSMHLFAGSSKVAQAPIEELQGIIYLAGKPAYIEPTNLPNIVPTWEMVGPAILVNGRLTPKVISWGDDYLEFPKDPGSQWIMLGQSIQLSYKISDNVGYLRSAAGDWYPLHIEVLKKGPRHISKNKRFLWRIRLKSHFFEGTYDVVQSYPPCKNFKC